MKAEDLLSQHDRAFFDALYQRCEGLIELRAIAAGKPPRHGFFTLDDESGLARFINVHRDDNVFFGVATRSDASSGALANCRSLTVLFVDLDFKQIPEAEARQRLAGCPFPPSAIIRSGGGLHVYWLLREPLDLRDEQNRILAGSLLRRLATFLGADLLAAEPARVMRVPDTLNHKYSPSREVTIELLEPDRRYDASEFDALLPPEPALVPNGPFVVPEQILDGQRNDTLYRMARSMKAKGYSKAAIKAAIHAENSAKCPHPLPSDEVEDIINHAWTQADRPEFAGASGAGADPLIHDPYSNSRPSINAGIQDLSVVTDKAWDALCHANDPPRLFLFGGLPIRIDNDENGAPVVRELTPDRLRHEIARAAKWFKEKK
jgi:primase-like protein